MNDARKSAIRELWWQTIRTLSPEEARIALLQALADVEEHCEKEHSDEPSLDDLGIEPDEYLTKLVERIRASPPIDPEA